MIVGTRHFSRVCAAVGLMLATAALASCSTGPAPSSSRAAAPRVAGTSVDAGATRAPTAGRTASRTGTTPRWKHVVVVVEENRDARHIIGRSDTPFISTLARRGLNFTDMHGERHPSEPNYLALLSGSTQGLTNDSCPHTYRSGNFVHQLLGHHKSFGGYAESLPRAGYKGCTSYPYARKHVPWTDFSNIPAGVDKRFAAFPSDYAKLPTLSFVIPNLLDDMHDGSVQRGDTWLREHLGRYATWARTHHSLLIVTWDEDEDTSANHIATVAVGQGIRPGVWSHRANHYSLLAALEKSFGLPRLGGAARARALPPIS